MNKKVKKKWLKALRSGEYKQTKNLLKNKDKYCCLGVLCDIHSIENNGKWELNDDGEYIYLGRFGQLPEEVMKWASLNTNDVKYKGKKESLMMANDNGYSFKQIANIIESQL